LTIFRHKYYKCVISDKFKVYCIVSLLNSKYFGITKNLTKDSLHVFLQECA
jgi:hypothetical protein